MNYAESAAEDLALTYPAVGVRTDDGRVYLDCYEEELSEAGLPLPQPLRSYLVDDETLHLVSESCCYHPGLPAKDLGLCEACLERYCEAGGR